MAMQDNDVRDRPFSSRAEAVAAQVADLFPQTGGASSFEDAQNSAYDAARALLVESREAFAEVLDERSIKPVRAILLVFVGWLFAVLTLVLGGAFVLIAQRL